MKIRKRWIWSWLAALLVLLLTACSGADRTNVLPAEGTEISEESSETGGSPEAEEKEAEAFGEEMPGEAALSGEEMPEDGKASEERSGEISDAREDEAPEASGGQEDISAETGEYPAWDAVCTSKEDVAAYIHQYGHLPSNFMTKKEAQELGWEGGSLEPYAPGMCIGGSRFGNYEGLLPEKDGRTYTECDIDTLGAKSRGAKRIVFSNDGLIYYTEDHYESFELLYGEEEP